MLRTHRFYHDGKLLVQILLPNLDKDDIFVTKNPNACFYQIAEIQHGREYTSVDVKVIKQVPQSFHKAAIYKSVKATPAQRDITSIVWHNDEAIDFVDMDYAATVSQTLKYSTQKLQITKKLLVLDVKSSETVYCHYLTQPFNKPSSLPDVESRQHPLLASAQPKIHFNPQDCYPPALTDLMTAKQSQASDKKAGVLGFFAKLFKVKDVRSTKEWLRGIPNAFTELGGHFVDFIGLPGVGSIYEIAKVTLDESLVKKYLEHDNKIMQSKQAYGPDKMHAFTYIAGEKIAADIYTYYWVLTAAMAKLSRLPDFTKLYGKDYAVAEQLYLNTIQVLKEIIPMMNFFRKFMDHMESDVKKMMQLLLGPKVKQFTKHSAQNTFGFEGAEYYADPKDDRVPPKTAWA